VLKSMLPCLDVQLLSFDMSVIIIIAVAVCSCSVCFTCRYGVGNWRDILDNNAEALTGRTPVGNFIITVKLLWFAIKVVTGCIVGGLEGQVEEHAFPLM
jgi:hypothetical protein